MNVLLVSDIFGINCSTHFIARSLSFAGNVHVLDPYDGEVLMFRNEQHAYQHFSDSGGIKHYVEKLTRYLELSEVIDLAIGFSAGGSALWQVSSLMNAPLIRQQVCFYPNQIRFMSHLNPKCPTRVILPEHEQHFCVRDLANKIQNKPLVDVVFVEQLHGFMNESSVHFEESARLKWIGNLMKLA